MNLLTTIKEYIYDNRHFIIASILSTVSIIGIIFVISIFKDSGKNNFSPDDYYANYNTTSNKNLSSDEVMSDIDSMSETTVLSDLNFTLPEDAAEESETTMPEGKYPYLIKVNRIQNCITIYTKDPSGKYTVPFKAMVCSTGRELSYTPTGTFSTSSKYVWRLMVDGTQSQYATRFNNGILFHSVPYYSTNKDNLEYQEFNKLGSPASLGCVRLCVADAKWIYDNCPYGTTVIVYDDESSPGPLGKPSMIKIPENSPNRGWDPTDSDSGNPWNSLAPSISVSDITINAGHAKNIFSTIKATDTCGNDISSSVKISGNYDTNKAGTYNIHLSVTDLLGRTASKDITLKVIGNSNTPTNNTSGNTNSGGNVNNNTSSNSSNNSSSNTGSNSGGNISGGNSGSSSGNNSGGSSGNNSGSSSGNNSGGNSGNNSGGSSGNNSGGSSGNNSGGSSDSTSGGSSDSTSGSNTGDESTSPNDNNTNPSSDSDPESSVMPETTSDSSATPAISG